MIFTEIIPSCHGPTHVSISQNIKGFPTIQCDECFSELLPNVYQHIQQISEINLEGACMLAQHYAEWSEDYNVPVPFVLLDLDGIFPKQIEGQTLQRLITSVKLFRLLNAPFLQNAKVEDITPDMENFLADYMNVIVRSKNQIILKDNEQSVLDHLLDNLHKVMDIKEFKDNKFGFYLEKLVPYVKACAENTQLLPYDTDTNVVNQLKMQMQLSQNIRKHFGKYNIQFDIFHVLVSCYACCVDIHAVANWALDVIAKICRGHYFWTAYASCKFVTQVKTILESEISFKRNTELYYVLRQMENGNGVESLSTNYLKYAKLELLVKEHIKAPPHLVDMICNQMFPAVVFKNPWDHMAFSIALSHVCYNINPKTGVVKKGTFSSARRLYSMIHQIMKQVYEFDKDYPLPWTIDTLKLFLVSDPSIDKKMANLAEVFFETQE